MPRNIWEKSVQDWGCCQARVPAERKRTSTPPPGASNRVLVLCVERCLSVGQGCPPDYPPVEPPPGWNMNLLKSRAAINKEYHTTNAPVTSHAVIWQKVNWGRQSCSLCLPRDTVLEPPWSSGGHREVLFYPGKQQWSWAEQGNVTPTEPWALQGSSGVEQWCLLWNSVATRGEPFPQPSYCLVPRNLALPWLLQPNFSSPNSLNVSSIIWSLCWKWW